MLSVAILPSAPMQYSQHSAPSLVRPSKPPAERPKLSLDTSNVPIVFNKASSTSLKLDSLLCSTSDSPTSRNTFQNAFGPPQGHTPSNSGLSASRLIPRATLSQADTKDASDPTPSTPSSSTPPSSTPSTIDSSTLPISGKDPPNVTSALAKRSMSKAKSSSQSKPMFPTPKQVSFRSPLTEEVKNVRFTWRHSDISSSTSTISTLEPSPPDTEAGSKADGSDQSANKAETVSTSSRIGEKRESSDEEESDACLATPGRSGRRKRNRQWVWTIPEKAASATTKEQRESHVSHRQQGDREKA